MTSPTAPGDSLSRREKLVYILLLGALTALGPFTIDLYLPAFPALEKSFDVSAAAIQLTLTGTTVGFGLGQLVVGPFSDKVGRRLPLILATAVHIASSIGAALATDIGWLSLFRVLMGIGAAGGGVVAMAMVRDLFHGYSMVRMFSRMSLVNGLAPILAPVIGSQLLLAFPWPGIFYFLASYGLLVILASIFFIKETLPAEQRGKSTVTVRQRYKSVLSDRIFVGMVLVGSLNFGGLFAYLSASTFLFQNVYGFSPQQYGILFGINSLGIVAGVQISSRLIRRVAPQWIVAGATLVMVFLAALIVVLDLLGAGLWGILVPLWFYICATGFMFPCVQVLSLANHGAQAGTAASLLGASQFMMAGIVPPVVGWLGVGSAVPMGSVMAVCILGSITALWLIVRPRTVPSIH
ncbi:DHA1 family bicyclomycin/chloramphenicol resistance-like MFS transporter [Paenarthrobacter ilicis]|uniref:DHA1 family bicyclomycin/chloramphenicol resistance-like MFS transporter n=1 Tax=Paenarthrobacter ilicis TaxID=43665 RepID=A0ABX0TEU7_9MICC|nr:DHA1 family bicyclomycin/chloramphenicol resistance-like MFS transporter [Paenarthrobacter ilicis]NIJ01050.1 DHA1 family bicyclomycin/chloramphenicol resistance-like MFS transporter [Paenarthrobacter ilicis]